MPNNLGRQYSLHADEYRKKAIEVLGNLSAKDLAVDFGDRAAFIATLTNASNSPLANISVTFTDPITQMSIIKLQIS